MSIILTLCILLLCCPLTARATLLFSADFENGTPNGPIGSWAGCSGGSCPSGFPSMPNSSAYSIVTSPVRQGTKARRITAKPDWAPQPCFLYGANYAHVSGFNCQRSEFERSFPNNHQNVERWYGFSVYIDPSTVYNQTNDPNGPLVFQLHGVGAMQGCSPITAPHVTLYFSHPSHGGKWKIDTHSNKGTCDQFAGGHLFDLGPWTAGVWEDFVFHIRNSYTSSGVFQVWRNGVLKVDDTGPNDMNSNAPADNNDLTKFGVYQSWWKAHTPPDPNEKMVIVHDAFKISDGVGCSSNLNDANSCYKEVALSTTPPVVVLTAPTNLAVTVGP